MNKYAFWLAIIVLAGLVYLTLDYWPQTLGDPVIK
jgi:hypothetical protein